MESREELEQVNIKNLNAGLRSKRDLYVFMQLNMDAYLPPYDSTNIFFLVEIIRGEKEYLKRADVRLAALPHYKGLTVKRLLEYVGDKPSLLKYLPEEKYRKDLDRTFLANILNTVDQAGLNTLLEEALKTRKEKAEQKKNLLIGVRKEFAQALQSAFLITSNNRGRATTALKPGALKRKPKEEEEAKKAAGPRNQEEEKQQQPALGQAKRQMQEGSLEVRLEKADVDMAPSNKTPVKGKQQVKEAIKKAEGQQ